MQNYNKIIKESNAIEVTVLPFFYQSIGQIDNEKIEKQIKKDVADFSRKYHLNVKVVQPDGMGGGGDYELGEFLYSLYENRSLVLFIFSILRNATKIFRYIKNDLNPKHNFLKNRTPDFHLKFNINITTNMNQDINTLHLNNDLSMLAYFINDVVSRLKDKYPAIEINSETGINNIPTHSRISYSQIGTLTNFELSKLRSVLIKTMLVPKLHTSYKVIVNHFVQRQDTYDYDYNGKLKSKVYYLFFYHRDWLVKDYFKKTMIELRNNRSDSM